MGTEDLTLAPVCFGSCESCVDEPPPPSGDPNFSVIMSASANDVSYDLTFGFSPNATDGYDSDVDQYAPPAPPPPAFDAALAWSGERFYSQIVNGSIDDLVEHEWDVQLQFPSSNQITLSWDNSGWSDLMESSVLQDAFGGMMINVDMLTAASVVLDNPAFNTLKLKVTPKEGTEPPPPSGVSVTFQVNMLFQDPSDGVYLRGGNIGSSDPAVPSMGYEMDDDDGDMIYSVTLELESNTHYNYKFATGESKNCEGN